MRPSAERQNIIGDLLNQRDTAADGIFDDLGGSVRRPRLVAGGGERLVRVCLNEQHPGYGIVFTAWLGTWVPATNSWDYTSTCQTGTGTGDGTLVYCIDWFYDGPYPAIGSTGLAIARTSTIYGTIYEIVTMDCVTPNSCCTGT
jgi:hypothetical protein